MVIIYLLLILLIILVKIKKKYLKEFYTNNLDYNLLFKNQYLICKDVKKNIFNHKTKFITKFGYYIYLGDTTNFNCYENSNNKIFIIGFIINPFNYKLNNLEITKNLCESTNLDVFFKKVQKLSGRFMIYLKLNKNEIILNDACSSKRVFYLDNKLFSSSEKILLLYLGRNAKINNKKMDYINSKKFQKNEFKWYDNSAYDNSINILLPNTYYNINNNNINRIHFFIPQKDNIDNIAKKISLIIKNSIKALHYRNKKIILPITGGTDSRVLLSCTKKFKDDINYYIFDNNSLKKTTNIDSIIANKFSKKFKLKFRNIKITDNKLDKDFEFNFKNNFIIPRIIPKTKNIEYHYKNNNNKNIININGNYAEVLKEHFDSYRLYTIDKFKDIVIKNNNLLYIQQSIEKFYDSSFKICNKYNIDITNLYHWELQQGLWGSLFPFEQDIAIEEFSPFNNRELLLLGLSVDKKYRKKQNEYNHNKKIIQNNWSELMYQKFNPKINEII